MATTESTNATWKNLNNSRTQLRALGNEEYRYFIGDWIRLLDVVTGGEREVKERGTEYLPQTSGQKQNTSLGDEIYCAYKERAVFYSYSKDTLIAMLGVMHAKKARFELPVSLEALNEEAERPEGWRVGLNQMLREINREQLTYARLGLLVDMPMGDIPTQEAIPKILMYQCFFILDWSTRELDNGDIVLDYVLLAEEKPIESDNRMARIEDTAIQLRILALDQNGEYYSHTIDVDTSQQWSTNEQLKEFNLNTPPPDAVYPMANGEHLTFIPFVFINVTDLRPDIQKSPLLQLANMDVSIYRGDADWAQAYFLQGQATPVFSGVSDQNDQLLLGAGGNIQLSDDKAKAYFMEVSGNGLGEMRERQTGLQNYATSLGISLVDQSQPESGKALETRVGIKSAPLATVAMTGAKGLYKALQYALFWKTGEMMADDLVIEHNKDFTTSTKAAKELLDLWGAKLGGAPISMRDIHEFARDNNFTRKTFEETLDDMNDEA